MKDKKAPLWFYIVLAGMIIALILSIRYYYYIAWQIHWTRETEIKCLEHGYPDTRFHLPQRKAYCVGTQGGNAMIIPVEELE